MIQKEIQLSPQFVKKSQSMNLPSPKQKDFVSLIDDIKAIPQNRPNLKGLRQNKERMVKLG